MGRKAIADQTLKEARKLSYVPDSDSRRNTSDTVDATACVTYTRVSTSGQAEDGVSLEMQKTRMEAYACSKGWQVVRNYEDGGVSGSKMNRPALDELMKDAAAGQFKSVLVYKLDRLSRSVADYYALSAQLQRHEVGLVSITQDFDTTTAAGRMMQNILVGFAAFERDLIVERTTDAEARMKEQGTLVCGRAPFGFRHVDKQLRYNQETLDVARDILKRATSGEPEREIARSLGLTRDQIRSVLHNSLFAGKIAYGRRGKNGTRVPYGKWQYVDYVGIDPILSFDAWLQLQQELGIRSDRSEGHTLPFFGRLLYCTKCGHLLSAHGNAKRKKTKYACQSSGQAQKACGTQLWEHYLTPVVLKKLSEELRGLSPRFDGKERLAALDARTLKCDRDITVLEARLANPDMSVEKVRQRIGELRELKRTTLQERAVVDMERAQLDEVRAILADFEPFFAKLDRKSQLEVMRRFVKRIDLGVTNIVIHWRFSETDCTVGRLEVSPEARKKGHGGRVVEIGGIDNLGVQLDASYGLLLNLLPNLPADGERQPSKQRKARRGKRVRA
jgi:site-specific DNA recombinase